MFTPDWFRYEIAHLGSKVGIKIEAERKAEYEKGRNGRLDGHRRARRTRQPGQSDHGPPIARLLLVKELVADMADRRSDRAILDYTQQSVVVRQHIDGVWHNSEARDREIGRRHAGRDEDAGESRTPPSAARSRKASSRPNTRTIRTSAR